MNINFIGINDKIINLDAIALIEDVSDDKPKALLTTNVGAEFELVGEDAEALFARAEIMMNATDVILAKMQAVEGVPQT